MESIHFSWVVFPRNSIRYVWLNDAAAPLHFKEFSDFFGCFSTFMPKVKAFDSTFYESLLNNNRMLANPSLTHSHLHIVIETSFAIKPYGMCSNRESKREKAPAITVNNVLKLHVTRFTLFELLVGKLSKLPLFALYTG